MATRKQAKSRRSKVRRANRKTRQMTRHHGGGWGFSGPAFVPSSGIPEMNRAHTDDCAAPVRPQAGGCGCMLKAPFQSGGGAGTGGYGFSLNNDMGKVYNSVQPYGCPQAGGNYSQQFGAVSYGTGYALNAPRTVNGIYYMDPTAYGRSCAGGSRKNRKNRKLTKRRK